MSDPSLSSEPTRFDGVVVVLAILLIAAPWLLGYSVDKHAAAASLVAGAAIFACVVSSFSDFTRGFREVDAALGALTAAAPFLFRFAGDRRALIAHLVVGGAVALISAGELVERRRGPLQAHAFWHFWEDKQ